MPFRFAGKLPSGSHLQQLKKSAQYKGISFQNFSPTPMLAPDASYWKMARDFFKKNKNAVPPAPLPSVKTDLQTLDNRRPVIIWFGHSSYFIRIAGKNILVDPVFSGNAAPLSFMVKAFAGSDVYKPADMPVIDYLILTHDHYDHLDFKTVRLLKSNVKKVYCSLGVSAHLRYWGYDEKVITELDWWETATGENIELTATPARHFSGRGLKRARTLWSSFVLKADGYSLFLGGDSGYDTHFKTIGEKFGPFDIAILEAGQYNVQWPLIHMMPEETVQAAVDLRARLLLPVHWGKFTLALHEWNEPVKRVVAKAEELGLPVATPRIGEPVVLGEEFNGGRWWEM